MPFLTRQKASTLRQENSDVQNVLKQEEKLLHWDRTTVHNSDVQNAFSNKTKSFFIHTGEQWRTEYLLKQEEKLLHWDRTTVHNIDVQNVFSNKLKTSTLREDNSTQQWFAEYIFSNKTISFYIETGQQDLTVMCSRKVHQGYKNSLAVTKHIMISSMRRKN